MKYAEMRYPIDELSLALECASVCNKTNPQFVTGDSGKAWGIFSPFQEKIDELIKKSGRITQEEKNEKNKG